MGIKFGIDKIGPYLFNASGIKDYFANDEI